MFRHGKLERTSQRCNDRGNGRRSSELSNKLDFFNVFFVQKQIAHLGLLCPGLTNERRKFRRCRRSRGAADPKVRNCLVYDGEPAEEKCHERPAVQLR